MHVRVQKVPALALAAALQVLPIARVGCINQASTPSGFAIVFKWFAGALALLGSYHAVSGASAAIAGLQNLNPPGPLTTNATGTTGQTFAYRIVVSNPGVNPQQAYYNAYPLPPGITINTNIGANGYITGVPTTAGVYPVTLVAGNANYVGVVTLAATITISGAGGSPPQITGPPTSQIVTSGASASFSVVANGTAPLSYQWLKDNATLSGATSSIYTISSVTTNSAGAYRVVVTNSSGSVTSAVATLTVLVPPSILTQPQSLTTTNGAQATFAVVAWGLPPPTYQWKFNGTNLAGATLSSYTIAAVQPSNTGDYTVDVSNSVGIDTSSAAHLTVQVPSQNPFTIAIPQWSNNTWNLQISGPAQTNYVVWRSANLTSWTPIKTNFSSTGSVQFFDPAPPPGIGFYRATLSP